MFTRWLIAFVGSGIFMFEPVSLSFFRRQVGFDGFSVGVVVGQGSMGLSEREMSDPVGDLLGGKTELVPDHNAPHGHASASDTGTASADAGCPSNQAADFHQGLCAHACNMTQFVLVVKLTSVRSPRVLMV
jgi:hypothetical protein